MKKILYTVFTAILIAMLVVLPAAAGGVSISPRLGSLIVDITAWGLPNNTDYTFTITASGIASVVCTNGGGNPAPGRNYPHVDGTASTGIPWQNITKGGKVTTSLEAIPPQEDPNYFISGQDGGCPNSNWSAKVDFVYWQSLKFDVTAVPSGITTTYLYSCVTKRTGLNSTPSTFDDGTVSCKLVK